MSPHQRHHLELMGWAVLFGTAACTSGTQASRPCYVGADCASGVCQADGTCAPLAGDTGGDSPSGDSLPGDTHGSDPAASDTGAADLDGGDAGGGCHPNYDETITAAESPFGPNLTANFKITTGATTFATAPDCTSTPCVWDLNTITGTTTDEVVETKPLAGYWFADEPAFADATYVTVVNDSYVDPFGLCDPQKQLGVFQLTSDALLLLGLVSEISQDDDSSCYTELIYTDGESTPAYKPVRVLKYPLAMHTTWTDDTYAEGHLVGWSYSIHQTFDSEVDGVGEVKTPYGDFQHVLRVNTLGHRHYSAYPMVSEAWFRTQTFVAECHTSIATVTSEEDSTEAVTADFVGAKEVRRLTLFP